MTQKQVNVSMPKTWFDQIERLARIYSVEEDKTLSYLDLIREALKEKFHLSDEVEHKSETE